MKYQVKKECLINSSINSVRPLIENFQHWNSWSPWTVIEPNCPIQIKGSPGQVGHSMSWDGEVIGSGKNTLTKNEPNCLSYDLEFFKPFKSQAKVQFLFEEKFEETQVTWTLKSSMPFFLFFMVKMMKNWIGMDYDRGLRMLKEIAEKGSVNCSTTYSGLTDYRGFSYVGIKRTVDINNLSIALKTDFEQIVQDVVLKRNKGARHWVTIFPKFDMKKMKTTYIAAVSDEDLKNESLDSHYIQGQIKDSRALEIKHDGSYDFLGNAWSMGMMYTRAKKYKSSGFPMEQYWNSPLDMAPEELKSSIYFPVKG